MGYDVRSNGGYETDPFYVAMKPYLDLVHGVLLWRRDHQLWSLIVPTSRGVNMISLTDTCSLTAGRAAIQQLMQEGEAGE